MHAHACTTGVPIGTTASPTLMLQHTALAARPRPRPGCPPGCKRLQVLLQPRACVPPRARPAQPRAAHASMRRRQQASGRWARLGPPRNMGRWAGAGGPVQVGRCKWASALLDVVAWGREESLDGLVHHPGQCRACSSHHQPAPASSSQQRQSPGARAAASQSISQAAGHSG
jgi:hypothetical protein